MELAVVRALLYFRPEISHFHNLDGTEDEKLQNSQIDL